MSFSHKAFAFSSESFAEELAPLLSQSLASRSTSLLEAFIERHISACSCPYDGEPLGPEWRELLEMGTTQELADFALTKYYEPTEDFGLGEAWGQVEATLLAPQRAALLGTALGPPDNLFDPGLQGSYFQSSKTVQESAILLLHLEHHAVQEFGRQLQHIAASSKGLYVTF